MIVPSESGCPERLWIHDPQINVLVTKQRSSLKKYLMSAANRPVDGERLRIHVLIYFYELRRTTNRVRFFGS
jgi:hypothetical protein